ncbi:Fructosamine/Ketosamine-3-kinase [Penicillium robsamsonii]|uniref:Fructosamine/Ketosamine-3-kinase n=1 Tax=Penicillium robsamsonii TaxID=1792511 RepID=UPI0025483BAF|nr:Fructosamine/Ketosamine-3-kinase [Penicillium robsamsonii]KAJ5834798.1 Fructosamine/Ketosamine-3-kinase [Penicillium robsamsonii]
MSTISETIVPEWTPPTFSVGNVPLVTPARSRGQDIEGDFPLDQIVVDHFPPGTQVHSCDRYGASAWTVTARIITTLSNGEPKLYFLKCAEKDQGKAMLEGEFNSMVELYKTSPNFVPEPYAWGKLSVSSPATYYFLCDFIEMDNNDPDPIQLATKLVQLHKASKSPTGMFGFHINTCQGSLPQRTAWNPSWVDFYIQLVRGAMALNTEKNGNWKNLEQLVDRLITHVVPQVLGPLEADGRVVKPTLIHGDLWDGNIGTSLENGELYIFDASVYYAHNEMEIAMWRARFCKTMSAKVYLNSYLNRMGVSKPVEQFEDRNRIYSFYMTLHESACHNGSSFREECYENLNYLINKYAPLDEGST